MAPSRSLRLALAAALLLAGLARGQQPADPYVLTPPEGWTRTTEGGALVLRPPGADADRARIIVLPPEQLEADFEAQAERSRAAVEAALGLSAPRLDAPSRSGDDARQRLSYVASYPSEGGDRYAGFYSLAEKKTFAFVVFYSATHDAFGRLATPAQALFLGLRVSDDAVGPPPVRVLPPPPSPAPPAVTSAPAPPTVVPPDLRERLLGAWTTFGPPGDVADPTWPQLRRAGAGDHWRFDAGGTYRHASRHSTSPPNWFGQVEEGRWTLEGDALTISPERTRDVSALERPPGKRVERAPVRYRVRLADGALVLDGPFGTSTLPRAR